MQIELNPNMNIEQLKQQFQLRKRLRIENILTTESADYILENLQQTAWHLVHSTDQEAPKTYNAQQLSDLSEHDLEQIFTGVNQRASKSYQFIYKYFPIINAITSGELPETSMLFQLAQFLNGTEFMKFARELTGDNQLVKIDPQASLYEKGHFLSVHDDTANNRTSGDHSLRRFAVVLGFTKNWSPNWGGQTMFFDSDTSHIAESWNPGFNCLTIFEVPTLHNVNYVTPFAEGGRYSVTGWLRQDSSISRADLDN